MLLVKIITKSFQVLVGLSSDSTFFALNEAEESFLKTALMVGSSESLTEQRTDGKVVKRF